MLSEEERRALEQKADEIVKASEETEAKLAALPFRSETEQLRATMEQLVGELHRMEKNLQAMIRLDEEAESKGGTENGND